MFRTLVLVSLALLTGCNLIKPSQDIAGMCAKIIVEQTKFAAANTAHPVSKVQWDLEQAAEADMRLTCRVRPEPVSVSAEVYSRLMNDLTAITDITNGATP